MEVGQKPGVNGQGRPYVLWSFKDQNGKWWGAGFKNTGWKQGDNVSFDIEVKGQYENAINVVVQGQAQPAPVSAPDTPILSFANTPTTPNSRDVSIQYQSSRKDAIALITSMLDNDVLEFGAKANQSTVYDIIMAMVEDTTAQLYLKLQAVVDDGGVKLEDVIPDPQEG
jgi:hypothetical protein